MYTHKRFVFLILAIAILIFAAPRVSQAQGGYSVTLAQVDTGRYPVISLYVNVRDASGRSAAGLKKEDFGVTEDGVAVEITEFAGTGDPRPVDIVFVFDTTASMTPEIEGVKSTSIAFAQKLKDKKRDFRLGLVTFGDEIRGVYKPDATLTDNAEEFKGWIGSLRAEGGGDEPENPFAALKQASQFTFRDKGQKIAILITDAPPHHFGDFCFLCSNFSDSDLTADRATTILKGKNFTLYAVAYDHPDYRQLVRETNGEFYNLTPGTAGVDFTGIIDKIGATLAEQYKMSYRSPRPTYDGTRRNIVVSVGGGPSASKGGGDYLEQHLVNFRSDLLIGLIFLAPLLFAVVAPLPFLLRKPKTTSSSPLPPSGPIPVPPLEPVAPSTPVPVQTLACSNCQNALRANARFCNKCGHKICKNCKHAVRPQARFCLNCGQAQ